MKLAWVHAVVIMSELSLSKLLDRISSPIVGRWSALVRQVCKQVVGTTTNQSGVTASATTLSLEPVNTLLVQRLQDRSALSTQVHLSVTTLV